MNSLNISAVLHRSILIWIKGFVPFTILAVLSYTPALIITAITQNPPVDTGQTTTTLNQDTLNISSYVLSYLITLTDVLVTALLAHGVFAQLNKQSIKMNEQPIKMNLQPIKRNEQPIKMTDCWNYGCRRIIPLFTLSLCLAFIFSLGTSILILAPASLFFHIIAWVAVPVFLVEKIPLRDIPKRCFFLTQNNRLSIFGLLFLIGITKIFFIMLLHQPDELNLETQLPWSVIFFVSILSGVLTSIAMVVSYHDLRIIRDHTTSTIVLSQVLMTKDTSDIIDIDDTNDDQSP